MPMLVQAMADANDEYYRSIDYKTLMTGGLSGVDAVVNTKGLEKTFPNLADPAKKGEFQAALEKWKASAAASGADTMEGVSNTILGDGPDSMLAVNAKTLQLPDAVLISEYADGAFAALDPFTSMIWPSELAEFTKATQGQFSGIGIQIETDDAGDLKVVRPLTGSPAAAAGIKSGDVIAKINGKNARNITPDQAVKYITGPAGTVVNITVRTPRGCPERHQHSAGVDPRRIRRRVRPDRRRQVGLLRRPGKQDRLRTHHQLLGVDPAGAGKSAGQAGRRRQRRHRRSARQPRRTADGGHRCLRPVSQQRCHRQHPPRSGDP